MEEAVEDFDGFGGAGEDNLSMPLGDFMAFLDSEPSPREDGEEQQPGVNQAYLLMPVHNTSSENAFQSHEDLSENSRNYNLNKQHVPMDALNLANTVEEAIAPPYEYYTDGLYFDQHAMHLDIAQARVENNVEGVEPQTNTYSSCNTFTEQSGLSEVKCEGTGPMIGNTEQEGGHFTSMPMFALDHGAAIHDISYTELNIGAATGSMLNGNNSCLTVQGEYLQGEYGEYPQPDYGSLDMANEISLHDLPQNTQSYDMEAHPQNICESSSMQVGSPDQYCDDTSQSDLYMDDVSSLESMSSEHNRSEDICFRSESSTDSSPIPSSRNSIEDADKYFGDASKHLQNSMSVTVSNQHQYTFMNSSDPMPSMLHKKYDIPRNGSSSILGNSSQNCFILDSNCDSDLRIIEGSSNPATGHVFPLQGLQHNFQQSLCANPIRPLFGGMRYKPHDERMTLRLALQDISQPKSEASPPDGVLAVPLLRHQKIALSWMVQKERSGANCSGGILADDQGLGKTVSTISLILTERSPVPCSSVKQEPCEAVTLDDDDDDDPTEPHLKKPVVADSSKTEMPSITVKTENPTLNVKSRPAAGTLVVCPTSVLRQWAEELRTKVTSKANLSFLIYHGSNRTKDHNDLTKYDVVLTTYAIVSMEVPKQSSPDSDEEEKEKHDRNPINGYKKLQVVLKTVMLRRTKATMLDGKPIISLPPKTVSLKTVDFTSEERSFYNTLEAESREQFKEYAAAGTVKQNYVNILLMLLRLRQACDHPHLVRGHESTSNWMSSLEVAKKLPMERQQALLICLQSCSAICALCNDAPEDAVVTICGHVFCNQCILDQLTGDDSTWC
ncbi:hypothetical protein GUJ93_ZPchr0001g30469 [Zizania palustris]|uniref:RING-type domain-containing protein n=1 Tax=Zizania palustris TaxID=103762 RepID=A0A8J5VD84_ZIZPA|nr:hypothetical protein GUJ93_ZPchr0001g30469 [Zizania palustris]